MSATPIIYSSLDAGSPIIDGQTSSLIVAMRAILVGTAGIAYGSKASAGWTEPYAAASGVAVFRNNSVVGSGAYLRVDDNATGTGGAREALVRAYKTMSSLSVGTDPTPTVAQVSGGLVVRKSSLASSAARGWWAIACRKWVYVFIDSSGAGSSAMACPLFAGDIRSIRAGDAYQFLLAGSSIQNQTGSANRSPFFSLSQAQLSIVPAVSDAYLMRNFGQAPGPQLVKLLHPFGIDTGIGEGGTPYPLDTNNGLLFSRALVLEAAARPRGYMPNLYWPWHPQPLVDLITQPDTPDIGATLVAKSFRPYEAFGSLAGQILFDATTED